MLYCDHDFSDTHLGAIRRGRARGERRVLPLLVVNNGVVWPYTLVSTSVTLSLEELWPWYLAKAFFCSDVREV